MRTETTTIYIAEDGRTFTNKVVCENYEASLRTKNIKAGAVFEDRDGFKVIVVEYCSGTFMLSNNTISTTFDNPFVLFVNQGEKGVIGQTKEKLMDYLTSWGYKYAGRVTTTFVREK